MEIKKIVAIVLCVLIICSVIDALMPKNLFPIKAAVVNPENGDVAICYHDDWGGPSRFKLDLFDKDGNKLFSSTFRSGGKSPRILIRDNNVHVYVWNLNELHSFDRSGKKIESFLTEDDFDKSTSFPGWTIKWSDLTYSFENYVYTIKLETIALSATKLTVSDGKQVKTLFSTSK